jgi:hypothetical protein
MRRDGRGLLVLGSAMSELERSGGGVLYDLKAGPAGGRSDEIGWPQSANLNQVHAAGRTETLR